MTMRGKSRTSLSRLHVWYIHSKFAAVKVTAFVVPDFSVVWDFDCRRTFITPQVWQCIDSSSTTFRPVLSLEARLRGFSALTVTKRCTVAHKFCYTNERKIDRTCKATYLRRFTPQNLIIKLFTSFGYSSDCSPPSTIESGLAGINIDMLVYYKCK